MGQCLKCRGGLILNSESKCESENQDTDGVQDTDKDQDSELVDTDKEQDKDCPLGQYYSEILKNCVSSDSIIQKF